MKTDRLLQFLRSAPGLKDLHLSLQTHDTGPRTEIDHVFGTYTWRSLEKLDVTGISATEDRLMRYLERHSRTLRGLRLTFFELEFGSWASIARRMQKSLNLAYVSFEFSGHDDYCKWSDQDYAWMIDPQDAGMKVCVELPRAIKSYICHGDETDLNPFENLETRKAVRAMDREAEKIR